jgi:hypothetical protein
MKNLSGTYKLIEPNKYQSTEGQTLIVSKRKNARMGMTSHFLLMVDEEGERIYLSSLYPINDNQYNIEYNRFRYRVNVDGGKLIINCA